MNDATQYKGASIMTERRKRRRQYPGIAVRLDSIRMTPSQRAEARHALELGARAADLILAAANGLRPLLQVPVARRTRRKGAAAVHSADAYHQI
jgi:hypothetical protein